MAIICDGCKEDVTPSNFLTDDMDHSKVIDINGKVCLCNDCEMFVGDFIASDKFKEQSLYHRKHHMD